MKYSKDFLTFISIVVLLTLSACANSGTGLLNTFAKTNDYTKVSDISYGIQPQNNLDIYNPSISTTNKRKNAVIVFFYGGCWGECTTLNKSDYLFVAQSLASRGFTTVIADFRQYPEVNFEGLMLDASNVIRWTSLNISKYGGDPNRIIVAGHSSGAHIASMLALNPRYLDSRTQKRIRGFVGLAGPYDFLPLDEAYQRTLFNPTNGYASSQPINFISDKSPPLLILHGGQDTTVGKHNAVNLTEKAQRLGVKHQLILYPAHDHVSILAALSRPLQGRSSVLRDMVHFIKQQTN
jgi:acetyl esterase/lipase